MKNKKIVVFMALFLLISSSVNGIAAFGEDNSSIISTDTSKVNNGSSETPSETTTAGNISSVDSSTEDTGKTETEQSTESSSAIINGITDDAVDKIEAEISARDTSTNESPESANAESYIEPTLEAFKKIVNKYPIGVATHFTAFAGGNLTIPSSSSLTGVPLDGTYAGKNVKVDLRGAGSLFVNNQDVYPITYGEGENKKSLALMGDNISAEGTRNTLLTINDPSNFLLKNSSPQKRYYYAFKDILDPITNDNIPNSNQLLKTTQATVDGETVEKNEPVQLNEIKDFYESFGTSPPNGESYFDLAKKQLSTISQYYSSFTSGSISSIHNSSISNSIIAKPNIIPNNADSSYLQFDVNLNKNIIDTNTSVGVPGVAILKLDYDSLSKLYSGKINYNTTINLIIPDEVDETDLMNKLPYLIFNWENWTTFKWNWGAKLKFTVSHESKPDEKKLMDKSFNQKMGTHMLHNFPDIVQTTADIVGGDSQYPFAGTIFIPNGDILFSSYDSDKFWGGLIAGGNVTVGANISSVRYFGSLFDSENLPDLSELSPSLTFGANVPQEINTTIDAETLPLSLISMNIPVMEDSNFRLKLDISDVSETTKHLELTFNNNGEDISSGNESSSEPKTSISIKKISENKELYSYGSSGDGFNLMQKISEYQNFKLEKNHRYLLRATIETDSFDLKNYAISAIKFINVADSGSLTLDAVPNLAFGAISKKDLAGIDVDEFSNPIQLLSSKNVENPPTSDGNNAELIEISDNRSTKSEYTLSLQLGAFKSILSEDGPVVPDIPIVLSLGLNDSTKNVLINNDKLVEPVIFKGKQVDKKTEVIKSSETNTRVTVDSNSALYIGGGSSLEAGTYQATLTWTLSNAPG